MDSGSNELFISQGKRKRRSVDESINFLNEERKTEETLSAIIRVLATGELEEEADNFYKNSSAQNNYQRFFK